MENVKFVCGRKGRFPRTLEYVFIISDKIAELIRKYSDYSEERLKLELSDNNEIFFRITTLSDQDPNELDEIVIETIERISNAVDTEQFWDHLLTDNGRFRAPAKFHELMRTEYGLTDDHIEWWVAHFFIHMSGILFDFDD